MLRLPRKLRATLFAFTLILLPAAVNAGGSDVGNGGDVVFCSLPGTKPRAQLLDLYEAKELYGLNLGRGLDPKLSDENMARAIVEKIDRVDPRYFEWASIELERVLKTRRFLSPETALTTIEDSVHPIFPRNCKVMQLANYIDDFGILIDRKYWNLLDPINRAALYVHEAVYKVEREFNSAKNSILSRRIVAFLFSNADFNPETWSKIRSGASLNWKPDKSIATDRKGFNRQPLEHDLLRGRCSTKYELRTLLWTVAPHGVQARFVKKIEFPSCAGGFLYATDADMHIRDCSGTPGWTLSGGGIAMCLNGAPEVPFWGGFGSPLYARFDTPYRQCDIESTYLMQLYSCE